jgi:flagellar motor switch protein FliM
VSSETLSQQEIDALFNGGATTETEAAPVEQPARPRADDVQVYDFRRPNLISKDRLRALEAMYGLMCKSIESWLTARVRAQIELELVGVEHFNYGEFVFSLPSPCSAYVFDISESGQQALIDFGRDFAFFLVDRLLGGSGTPLVQDRVLTPLERMVVRIAADQIATELNSVWKEHVGLGLTMSRFESMPEMLRTSNREDPVLVANLMVKGASFESPLVLCLPFAVLEKFFTGSGSHRVISTHGTPQERQFDRTAIEQSLRGAHVPVSARFPTAAVAMQDLAYLQVGQTMMTGLPHDVELDVWVGPQRKYIGLPGRAGNRIAVRLKEPVDSSPSQGAAIPSTRLSIMSTTTYEAEAAAETAPASGVKFTEMEATGGATGASALSSLFRLTLPVTIELGRAQMTVQEVLDLTRGSVIQLDRLVGEPVDVLVGDRRFAEGEVVVVGEQFGVRITRIISAQAALEGAR